MTSLRISSNDHLPRGSVPTPEERKKILRARTRRLQESLPLWARKCYTILDKDRMERPLVFNQVQRAIYMAERVEMKRNRRVRQYILKGRQGGVTTYEEAANLHAVWSVKGAQCLTLATDRDLMDKVFQITTRAINNFPPALLPPLGDRRIREIAFPTRDSSYFTGTSNADRAGAGTTLYRFHGTEFAHWDDPKETLKAVGPTIENDGTLAALETTGGGFNSDAHIFWKETKAGGTGYTPLFFPWWQCDPLKYRLPLLSKDELTWPDLTGEERELVHAHRLDFEQIKWRRAKIREYGKEDFLQEYAEDEDSCWLAPGGMFYDVEVLKWLKIRPPVPLRTEMEGRLEWYIEPSKVEGPVIIGADTAEGSGGENADRSALTARQKKDWKAVCKFESAAVQPKDFAGIVNTVGRQLGKALLVVEKNSHGITVLRELRDDLEYPVEKIYHRVPLDKEQADDQRSERIGWVTTRESLPLMLDAGRDLINAAKDGLAGPLTDSAVSDAFAVRRGKTGKVSLNGKDVLTSEILAWLGRGYDISPPRITVFDL